MNIKWHRYIEKYIVFTFILLIIILDKTEKLQIFVLNLTSICFKSTLYWHALFSKHFCLDFLTNKSSLFHSFVISTKWYCLKTMESVLF